MRKHLKTPESSEFTVMIIDDDEGIVDSISALLHRSGYQVTGITSPIEGLEMLGKKQFDLLILDYFMHPIHGDEVVSRLRAFSPEIYVLLLTGHKDLAPPLSTIRALDIQGYCEKSDRLDQLVLLVESGIKSISQIRTIQKFRDGLNSILGAVPKIYQLQPLDNILEEILIQILPLVNSHDAFILVDDLSIQNSTEDKPIDKTIYKGIGAFSVTIGEFTDMLGPELMESIGLARTNKKALEISDGVIIPLVINNDAIGVIYVNSSDVSEGIRLLEIYAGQAASSLSNAQLHSLINIRNEELNKTYTELKKRYMDTIEALRLAVDARDVYTRGHSDRVALFAKLIGERMGLSDADLEKLKIGGIFHDIGKIGTGDDILLKNERLTDDEIREIQKHPIKGALILSAVSMFSDVVPIVRSHHERIDGTGYPDGLRGDQIPLLARIIAVADAFDAMTSDRQYRTRLTLDASVEQLRLGRNSQFDSKVIDVFLDILSDNPVEIEKILDYC